MLAMADTLRRLATGDMPQDAEAKSRQSPYQAGAESRDQSDIQGADRHRL
jgi:hypothetical protein